MDNDDKANAVAHQIATMALLQTIYGALMNASTKAEFRQMGQALEASTVARLDELALHQQVGSATKTYVKEAASDYVSRFFASIKVPDHLP